MRILILGDSCALTTGFSQVIQRCITAFNAQGWELHQIASLDKKSNDNAARYAEQNVTPWFPVDSEYDPIGNRRDLPWILKKAKPDLVFMNVDPGMAGNWLKAFTAAKADHIPIVYYGPIEGAPVCEGFAYAFIRPTRSITYTQWSADRIEERYGAKIPWVYHGVDRSVWHPIDEGARRRIRRALGWEGKFVVSYVARNAARKAQDRLIKAMSLLNEGTPDAGLPRIGRVNDSTIPPRKDYVLYLHCRDFDNNALGGWDLSWLANYYDLGDQVQFASTAFSAIKGETAQSLANKLGCSDLYVSAAKVEGFGLPLIEAMATGLPMVIPADGGNQQEVVGKNVALACLEPSDWDTWFNGAQLANVDPSKFAGAIHVARENRKLREVAAERSLIRAKDFSWDTMSACIVDAMKDAYAHPETSIMAQAMREEQELAHANAG